MNVPELDWLPVLHEPTSDEDIHAAPAAPLSSFADGLHDVARAGRRGLPRARREGILEGCGEVEAVDCRVVVQGASNV